MGYTTDFNGSFELSRPATVKEANYINDFADSRRMKRNPHKLYEKYNGKHGHITPKDDTPIGIYGEEGEYFTLDSRDAVIDANTPPGQVLYSDKTYSDIYAENDRRIENGECQPGLWCQWVINEDGTELVWDGGEKFHEYTEWVKYLIKHFFEPWGIKLNGEVRWSGEDYEDKGLIVIKNNVVTIKYAKLTYE